MSHLTQSDRVLVDQIRRGNADAWNELIARFEGRLLAFVAGRIGNRSGAEDVVQETFLGFLNSLPNFDTARPLDSYLFSIAAHKLTDHLRREGRRPALPLSSATASDDIDLPDDARAVSSLARSDERRDLEVQALVVGLSEQIARMRDRGEWQKLSCLELLMVRGWANRDVAAKLGISEQAVANFKFDFTSRLRNVIRKQALSADVFPELYAEE